MGLCCCCSLKTGGIIIAIFEIVFWSISLAISGNLLVVHTMGYIGATTPPTTLKSDENGTTLLVNDTKQVELTAEEIEKQKLVYIAHILLILNFILAVIRIIVACILIFGILKNKITLVKGWFGVKICVLFLTFGLLIATVANGQFRDPRVISYTLSMCISFYFLRVIYKLMIVMKSAAISARIPKPNRAY